MARGRHLRGAVIFLHGSGDTGQGVRQWLEAASSGKFERSLKELGLAPVLFPTAPETPYTLAGGMPSTVWFDRHKLSPGFPQDRAGVLRSLRQIEEEVRKLEDEGVPSTRVFVGGFSMGGCLALEVLGYQPLATRIAGVFSHASFLNNDSAAFETAADMRTPVYSSHGTADGMVKAAWGRATAERLRGRGLDMSFTEHDGLDHELGEEQIAGLLGWISSVVDRPEFGQSKTVEEDGDGGRISPKGGDVLAEPPCSVTYDITDLGGYRHRVLFKVPPGSEELLSGASICARGGIFQLETVPSTLGQVVTTLMSPKPELTSAAIARRIEQRLGDPRPPGIDEACCLS
eukprot:jgi/Undpi1/755/HiC_scaffold_10.g04219.m1